MNPLIARARELRRAGRRIIDLSNTNFHSEGLRFPDVELAEYFNEYFRERNYAPESLGRFDTRLAISEWYADQSEHIDPGHVLLTASTSESYALIFQALSEAGESVLLPSPTYPLFEQLCTYARLHPAYYRLDSDRNFAVDFDSVRKGLDRGPSFAVTISPNNPTGAVMSARETREFARLCAEADVQLIEDEVFRGMVWGDRTEADPMESDTVHMEDESPRSPLRFKLGGVSKLFASPDVKLAWIAVKGSDPDGHVIDALELAVDTYLNASGPSQFAVSRMFAAGEEVRENIRSRLHSRVKVADRRLFGDEFPSRAPGWPVTRDASGGPNGTVRVYPQAGGIHRVVHVPGAEDESLAERLLEDTGVLVHPGYFYGFPDDGYWVISTVSREPVLDEGLAAVAAFLGLR